MMMEEKCTTTTPLAHTPIAQRIIAISETWIGTPYRHLWMKKKRGADCTLFLGGIFLEGGILARVERPEYYSRDWHMHTTEELVLESLVDHLKRNLTPGFSAEIIRDPDPNQVQVCDLMAFWTCDSKISNHAGMYLGDDHMINSINGRGVVKTHYGRFWKERLTTVFRVLVWE